MADAPDINQAMQQLQQSLNAQRNSAGGAPILGLLPGGGRDIDIGGGLSLKGKGLLNADGMVNKLPQAKQGGFAKLLKDMGVDGKTIVEGMQKVAQAGPVKEASQNDIFGAGGAPAGGFAANISRGGDDGGLSA